MKTIIEGKESVCKLLGKQRLKSGTQYRLMKYLLRAECEDGVLLHNVITGQLVLLSLEEAQALEKLPAELTEIMTELIEDHFLVPISYDEKTIVDNLRILLGKLATSDGINNYTILTTTNCNARCFYCYESNYHHINMSEQTADRLFNHMIQYKGKGKLLLEWFGGEPLIGINRIDQICNNLKMRNIKFESGITTNGYLFTQEIVGRIGNDWNLTHAQITIDGTEDIYNKTKAYVSAKGSPYKKVIRNIRLLLEYGINVAIRLNLDRHNFEDLRALIDELKMTFFNFPNLIIYVHVTFRGNGFCPIERSDSEEAELYCRQVELNRYIEEIGFSKANNRLPSLNLHSCTADNARSLIVYPDGSLYRCEHLNEEDKIGHIESFDGKELGLAKFRETTVRDACYSCPLYPKCILLKRCPGKEYRNDSTCEYDIQTYLSSIKNRYSQVKMKTNES